MTARLPEDFYKTTTVRQAVCVPACLPSRDFESKFPRVQEVVKGESLDIRLHIAGRIVPN